MVLETYEGAEPLAATSARFTVRVRQASGRVHLPHVFETRSPDDDLTRIHPPDFCALHGGCLCKRSMAWVVSNPRLERRIRRLCR